MFPLGQRFKTRSKNPYSSVCRQGGAPKLYKNRLSPPRTTTRTSEERLVGGIWVRSAAVAASELIYKGGTQEGVVSLLGTAGLGRSRADRA